MMSLSAVGNSGKRKANPISANRLGSTRRSMEVFIATTAVHARFVDLCECSGRMAAVYVLAREVNHRGGALKLASPFVECLVVPGADGRGSVLGIRS